MAVSRIQLDAFEPALLCDLEEELSSNLQPQQKQWWATPSLSSHVRSHGKPGQVGEGHPSCEQDASVVPAHIRSILRPAGSKSLKCEIDKGWL
jgi:hypothetical protein